MGPNMQLLTSLQADCLQPCSEIYKFQNAGCIKSLHWHGHPQIHQHRAGTDVITPPHLLSHAGTCAGAPPRTMSRKLLQGPCMICE